MGDNAVVDAAAIRAANDVIRARGDKEMTTILTLVPDLKDVEFHIFVRALESAAYF